MEKLLSLQEAANMLNVTPMTLRRWDESGKLTAVRLGARGDRKYRIGDLQKFIDSGRQFASDTLQNFLSTGLMYYAYQEEADYKYKFTLPENPLGCSELVTQALKSLRDVNLSHYPHVAGKDLAVKLADRLHVPQENIVVGAGALDLEILIFTATINKGDKVVIPKVSFPATEFIALLANAEISFAPMSADLDIDYGGLEKVLSPDVRVAVLSNPNNPTGKSLQKEVTLKLIKDHPSTLFVIDEANIELSTSESFLGEVFKHKNLVVVRTFSKGYGLAGARVGYLAADKELTYLFSRRQTPFSVNSLGLHLAGVALNDPGHIEKSKDFVLSERRRIEKALSEGSFESVASDSIYLLVKVPGAYLSSTALKKKLNESNIDVVDGTSFRGLGNQYIRLCPRDKAANDFLIQTIRSLKP